MRSISRHSNSRHGYYRISVFPYHDNTEFEVMGAAAFQYRLLEPLAVSPLVVGQPLQYNLTTQHADTDMRLLYRQDRQDVREDVRCVWLQT